MRCVLVSARDAAADRDVCEEGAGGLIEGEGGLKCPSSSAEKRSPTPEK